MSPSIELRGHLKQEEHPQVWQEETAFWGEVMAMHQKKKNHNVYHLIWLEDAAMKLGTFNSLLNPT